MEGIVFMVAYIAISKNRIFEHRLRLSYGVPNVCIHVNRRFNNKIQRAKF